MSSIIKNISKRDWGTDRKRKYVFSGMEGRCQWGAWRQEMEEGIWLFLQ